MEVEVLGGWYSLPLGVKGDSLGARALALELWRFCQYSCFKDEFEGIEKLGEPS